MYTHSTLTLSTNAYHVRPSYVRTDGWRPYERQYAGRRTPITLADLSSAVRHFDATFGVK